MIWWSIHCVWYYLFSERQPYASSSDKTLKGLVWEECWLFYTWLLSSWVQCKRECMCAWKHLSTYTESRWCLSSSNIPGVYDVQCKLFWAQSLCTIQCTFTVLSYTCTSLACLRDWSPSFKTGPHGMQPFCKSWFLIILTFFWGYLFHTNLNHMHITEILFHFGIRGYWYTRSLYFISWQGLHACSWENEPGKIERHLLSSLEPLVQYTLNLMDYRYLGNN